MCFYLLEGLRFLRFHCIILKSETVLLRIGVKLPFATPGFLKGTDLSPGRTISDPALLMCLGKNQKGAQVLCTHVRDVEEGPRPGLFIPSCFGHFSPSLPIFFCNFAFQIEKNLLLFVCF